MGKIFKHLTREDRIQIELLLKLEYSVSKISKMLGVHYSTIYREISIKI